MIEYFKSWRRQAGLALLAVASAERVVMIISPRVVSEAWINFLIAAGLLTVVWPRKREQLSEDDIPVQPSAQDTPARSSEEA
jgi:hypothetical protein